METITFHCRNCPVFDKPSLPTLRFRPVAEVSPPRRADFRKSRDTRDRGSTQGQFRQWNGGFSLIELIVYIAITAIIAAALVAFGFWIIKANAKMKLSREITDSARAALETISYEIKKSQSVYTPTSILDSNPGQLSLEQKTAAEGETETFVDFFKCGDALCLKKEGLLPVSLTSEKIKVSKLIFTQLQNSATSTSVQINLKLESAASTTQAEYSDSIDLTTTANLRVF